MKKNRNGGNEEKREAGGQVDLSPTSLSFNIRDFYSLIVKSGGRHFLALHALACRRSPQCR
jgi:hypothetical protein